MQYETNGSLTITVKSLNEEKDAKQKKVILSFQTLSTTFRAHFYTYIAHAHGLRTYCIQSIRTWLE